MKLTIILFSTLGFFAGLVFGAGIRINKIVSQPIEIYCPMTAEGEPTIECYSEFVVDGNCAYINSRIICGGGYVLTVK